MKKIIYTALFTLATIVSFSQNKMRTLEELINKTDPGWPFVQQWIDSSKNKVEILPADTAKANVALYHTQVTTRSPMGAIVYNTGGILIDNGWIRILGSGSEKLTRSLPNWNKGKSFTNFGDTPPFLLIADDVIGGFFLLNGGALGKDLGKVYYFSPDNLTYEPLDLTYTEFLIFCFDNDLNDFYKEYKWPGWQKDLSGFTGDKMFNFYPPAWSGQGKDPKKNRKGLVPAEEQYLFNMSTRSQLGIK